MALAESIVKHYREWRDSPSWGKWRQDNRDGWRLLERARKAALIG